MTQNQTDRRQAFRDVDPAKQLRYGFEITKIMNRLTDAALDGAPWDFHLFAYMCKHEDGPDSAEQHLVAAGYGLSEIDPITGHTQHGVGMIDPRLEATSEIYRELYGALSTWQSHLVDMGPSGPGPFQFLVVQYYPNQPASDTNPAVLPLWAEQMELDGHNSLTEQINEFTHGALSIDLHMVHHTIDAAINNTKRLHNPAQANYAEQSVPENTEPVDSIDELHPDSKRARAWRTVGFDPFRVKMVFDDKTKTLTQTWIGAENLPEFTSSSPEWTATQAGAFAGLMPGYFADERSALLFEQLLLSPGRAKHSSLTRGLIDPDTGRSRTRSYCADTAYALTAPGAVALFAEVGSVNLDPGQLEQDHNQPGQSHAAVSAAVSGSALPGDHGCVIFEIPVPEEMLLDLDLDLDQEYAEIRMLTWRTENSTLLVDLFSDRTQARIYEHYGKEYLGVDHVKPYLDLIGRIAVKPAADDTGTAEYDTAELLMCSLLAQLRTAVEAGDPAVSALQFH